MRLGVRAFACACVRARVLVLVLWLMETREDLPPTSREDRETDASRADTTRGNIPTLAFQSGE